MPDESPSTFFEKKREGRPPVDVLGLVGGLALFTGLSFLFAALSQLSGPAVETGINPQTVAALQWSGVGIVLGVLAICIDRDWGTKYVTFREFQQSLLFYYASTIELENMLHIRRRQLLAGLSVAGLSGTVGCADFQLSGNSPTQICEITVINQYPEQVRSTLKITRDSEVLVENTAELNSPTQTADTHNVPADELPPKSEYVITLTVTGEGWSLEDQYTPTDEDFDSTALMWLIESNSQQEGEPTLQLFIGQEDTNC